MLATIQFNLVILVSLLQTSNSKKCYCHSQGFPLVGFSETLHRETPPGGGGP